MNKKKRTLYVPKFIFIDSKEIVSNLITETFSNGKLLLDFCYSCDSEYVEVGWENKERLELCVDKARELRLEEYIDFTAEWGLHRVRGSKEALKKAGYLPAHRDYKVEWYHHPGLYEKDDIVHRVMSEKEKRHYSKIMKL